MSPRFCKAESRERNAPADRKAELERLARACLDLSHDLKDLRNEHSGFLNLNDYSFITGLAVELAAYGVILQMDTDRRIDWLSHTIAYVEKTTRRVFGAQGGVQ